MKDYFAEFENVFMCLMTYFFAITKDSIIQNLFQKLSIFKTECSSSEIWDCQWHKTVCNTSFLLPWSCCFFQIIKICQFCGFSFTNFFLFLMTTNALAASWGSFLNTRIFFVFFLSQQKDKNTFKDNSQSEYFIY